MRPRALTPDEIKLCWAGRQMGIPDARLAEVFGVSPWTIRRAIDEYDAQRRAPADFAEPEGAAV